MGSVITIWSSITKSTTYHCIAHSWVVLTTFFLTTSLFHYCFAYLRVGHSAIFPELTFFFYPKRTYSTFPFFLFFIFLFFFRFPFAHLLLSPYFPLLFHFVVLSGLVPCGSLLVLQQILFCSFL